MSTDIEFYVPTHSIVPYRFKLREKGDSDNNWSLTNLTEGDDSFPKEDIFDLFEDFLDHYAGSPDKDEDREKFFNVSDYNVGTTTVEAIVETGDYGYRAELKDVDTGEQTYEKDTDESEVLPFYFLFWLPKTVAGEWYENGERGIMVFQQLNGRGIKTGFYKRFRQAVLDKGEDSPIYESPAEETMFELNPITTQDVLRELINSQRVRSAEFELDEAPSDSEGPMQYAEGLDTRETDTQLLVLKPDYKGSLNYFRDKAEELEEEDSTFAEVVGDEVSELSVEIDDETGHTRKISLIDDDEISMRRILEPDEVVTNEGIPTRSSIANRTIELANKVLEDTTCELNYTTNL